MEVGGWRLDVGELGIGGLKCQSAIIWNVECEWNDLEGGGLFKKGNRRSAEYIIAKQNRVGCPNTDLYYHVIIEKYHLMHSWTP